MQITPQKTQSARRAAQARFALQLAEQAHNVGERIRYEREKREWSKAELARQLPGVVSGNDIYRWESGKHMPRSDTLEGMAELFGISQADFHAGKPEKKKAKRRVEGKSPLDALSKSDLPAEVSAAVDALRQELVETRIQLLAEIAKVQETQAAQQSPPGSAGSRSKSNRK